MIRSTLLGAAALCMALGPQALAASYVSDAQPILGAKCGVCHTDSSSGGHSVGTSYEDSQKVANKCDDSNIAECSVARIEDGTMPLGKNCGGVVADDADNADVCVTESEFAVLQAWLEAGSPEEDSGDADCTSDEDCSDDLVCSDEGACVEGGGEPAQCESDDECNEGEVCASGDCVSDGGDVVDPGCETDDDCGEHQMCDNGDCMDDHGAVECHTDEDCGAGGECSGEMCFPGPPDGGTDDGTGDGGEATPSSSDGGGCQAGGGPIGSMVLLLAGVALISRRRSLFVD